MSWGVRQSDAERPGKTRVCGYGLEFSVPGFGTRRLSVPAERQKKREAVTDTPSLSGSAKGRHSLLPRRPFG